MARSPAGNESTVRRHVLTAARESFVVHGYDGTTLEAVAARARVEPEAVQALFGDRRGLFVAVFEEADREANGAALAAARSVPQDGISPILAGCRRILEVYVDGGPSLAVLGEARQRLRMEEWFAIDRRFGAAAIRGGLRDAAEHGVIDPSAIDALTMVLYGAMTEACLVAPLEGESFDLDGFVASIERTIRAHAPA